MIPAGLLVEYDVVSGVEISCLEVSGSLVFGNRDATLWVSDVQVLPGGHLVIGTAARPIQPQHRVELVLRDTPLRVGTLASPGIDPEQFLTGFLVWGRVTIHGAPMRQTFIRLAQEAYARSKRLILEHPPEGWRAGDRVFIPDTRQVDPATGSYRPQWEERTIQSIDGTTVYLQRSLKYDHLGAHDADEARTLSRLSDGTPFLPHVANLSRNVVIRSENPQGTRGHTFFASRAEADVRYALWKDLGRTHALALDVTTTAIDGTPTHIGTNQNGRYPYHHHYLIGPRRASNFGYQFISVGNAIVGSAKWGMVIQQSHYGLVKDNIVVGAVGAGIAMATGNEVGNLIQRNFVAAIRGGFNADGALGRFGEKQQLDRDSGERGDAFWFASPFNTVIDNVAANAARTGYVIFPRRRTVSIPGSRGMTLKTVQQTNQGVFRAHSLADWLRNEAYGAMMMAVTLSSQGGRHYPEAESIVLKDQRVWHVSGVGVPLDLHPEYELDGWVQRHDLDRNMPRLRAKERGDRSLVTFTGPKARRVYLRNFDGQGAHYGILNRGRGSAEWLVIENTRDKPSLLRNHIGVAIRPWVQRPAKGTRTTLIRNVVFEDQAAWNNKPLGEVYGSNGAAYIAMEWERIPKKRAMFRHEQTYIENYQNRPGENYQLFYEEQAPHFVIPDIKAKGKYDFPQCVGMTNRACWAEYRAAVAGEVAPCLEAGDPDCSQARELAAQLKVKGLAFRMTKAVPQPPRFQTVLKLALPIDGQVIDGPVIDVEYYISGDQREVDHVRLKFGDDPEVIDSERDGRHQFKSLRPGVYAIEVSARRSDGSLISERIVRIKVTAPSAESYD